MINMSFRQFAEIWINLEDAYRNRSSYGGDTIEIYCFRLAYENSLAKHGDAEEIKEFAKNAADSLYDILSLFKRLRNCLIFVEDYKKQEFREFGDWIKEKAQTAHRYHIRIEPI